MTPPRPSASGKTAPTATLSVWVQPGASRERIVGMRGDDLKVCVAVPPEKGKANKAVVALLADALELPISAVSVVSGTASRQKTVRLEGISAGQLQTWLETWRKAHPRS